MRIIGPVIGFARLIRRARRALALPVAMLVLAPPIPVNAQVPDGIPRLCFVTFDARNRNERFKPFFERLHDLGYVDGQTIKIDYLSADAEADRFASLADQCLQLKANIIVVTTTPAAQAVKNATHTVPIVMFPLGDPVGTGLVASLARPGGNVTGLSFMADGIAAKRLQLLKEAVPNITRVLVLSYLLDPIAEPQVRELERASRALHLELLVQDIRTAADLPAGFDAGARERVDALLTTAESIFVVQRKRVVELAAQYKLPAMYAVKLVVEAGGLMAYDSYTSNLVARAAIFVDKILRGAEPADLPVEQPTKLDLVVNLKTAQELSLTIPQSILARADEVIE